MNNTYKNRSVQGMLITWIICLCLLLLLSVFTSCTSQKHLTYQRDTSDMAFTEYCERERRCDTVRFVTTGYRPVEKIDSSWHPPGVGYRTLIGFYSGKSDTMIFIGKPVISKQ